MTMMASFLSNINIPAGSLFSPGAKPLFHFESSLWRLETFPWYFFLCSFICLYPGDVPTCHIKHRLPYFLGAEVKTVVAGELGGWVGACLFHKAPPQRRIFSQPRPRQRFWHLHQSEKRKVWVQTWEIDPPNIDLFFSSFCMKWNPPGLRHSTVRLITSVQIKFCDFSWLTKEIRVPKVIFHCHLEPPKCTLNFTNCLFCSADVPHS